MDKRTWIVARSSNARCSRDESSRSTAVVVAAGFPRTRDAVFSAPSPLSPLPGLPLTVRHRAIRPFLSARPALPVKLRRSPACASPCHALPCCDVRLALSPSCLSSCLYSWLFYATYRPFSIPFPLFTPLPLVSRPIAALPPAPSRSRPLLPFVPRYVPSIDGVLSNRASLVLYPSVPLSTKTPLQVHDPCRFSQPSSPSSSSSSS